MNMRCPVALSGFVVAVCASSGAYACSCGCGVFDVGTDSMFPSESGATAFVEYDYVDQNDNWHGDSRAPNADNEDKRVATAFVNTGLRYMFDRAWGMAVEVPYWKRTFRTTEDSPSSETYTHSSIGDVRVRATYAGFSEDMSIGMTFGVKLPTGDSNYRHFDADNQIGSGSTDLLLGAYRRGVFEHTRLTWFVDAQWQQPIAHENDYRPGSEVNVAAGASYRGWTIGDGGRIAPMLQVKVSLRDNDGGSDADPDNTGYERVSVHPGVVFSSGKLNVHVDIGLPLYTHVNGNQLIASDVWKINVGYRF